MSRFGKVPCHTIFLLLFFVLSSSRVCGRFMPENELVNDGIDHVLSDEEASSLITLNNGLSAYSSEERNCEQMYGFLPCTDSIWGHLFLIMVYEYLLIKGESCVAEGGERIFNILGTGIFGASVFQVLGSLPEALILLASGLLNDNETAQEYVLTGVGLLAGSSIFQLTILWGTCLIVARRDLKYSAPSNSTAALTLLTGTGIKIDEKTTYTSRIMVLSIIPFIVFLVPSIFGLSSASQHFVMIFTLILSFLYLFFYFLYMTFQPWIQMRRLEYVKHEHLVVDILKHVQQLTLGKLLTQDGAPNVPIIKSLFEDIDRDGDSLLSFAELKQLLGEIRYRKEYAKEETFEKVAKEFDLDGNNKITMDEFVDKFSTWLDQTKTGMDREYHSAKSLKDLYQILQPWIVKKRQEKEMKHELIDEIIRHVQSSALGALFKPDGTPDISAIKRLFEKIDVDKDNCISPPELKMLLHEINFGKISWDEDQAVAKIMEELDLNGDHVISQQEFVSVFEKWLDISPPQTPKPLVVDEDMHQQKKWEETDVLVEDKSADKSIWGWSKAIILLIFGILILGLLAEPLIHSVQSFSNTAHLPSFFVSFVLVPLASNARIAISAITAASRKKPRTTSLTFSEIYGAVFMNNVLGFAVLLSLICLRRLTWHFSAEVLAVLIVTAVVGSTASLRSVFPLWTAFAAFLLYPSSLLLVYLLD